MRRLIFLLINTYTLLIILGIPVHAYNRTKTLPEREVLKNASSVHLEFCASINVTAMCLTQSASIKTESSLLMAISKLTEEDFQNVVNLLESHPELVTVNLFEGSIKLGAITLKYIPDKSLRFYRTALEIAKILNIEKLKAEAYYSLSIVYTILYKIDDAIEALNESRGFYQKVNDKTGSAKTVANLASLYLFKNNYIMARGCALSSLEIVNTYHDEYSQQEDYSIAISYSVLAYLLAFDGMSIQSMEYYQRALSLLTRLDRGTDQYALNITEVFSGLGRVYYQLGDYAHSLLMLEQAIIYAGKTHLNDRVAGVYNILGTLFYIAGKL
ncbi:MAG: tetratricopeptide repeat protein [Acidobacteria bacterium]|nr:tetratricopeptide repeat protein [Acidobacteriota bacterium]